MEITSHAGAIIMQKVRVFALIELAPWETNDKERIVDLCFAAKTCKREGFDRREGWPLSA